MRHRVEDVVPAGGPLDLVVLGVLDRVRVGHRDVLALERTRRDLHGALGVRAALLRPDAHLSFSFYSFYKRLFKIEDKFHNFEV